MSICHVLSGTIFAVPLALDSLKNGSNPTGKKQFDGVTLEVQQTSTEESLSEQPNNCAWDVK